jgi:hypothetical protein
MPKNIVLTILYLLYGAFAQATQTPPALVQHSQNPPSPKTHQSFQWRVLLKPQASFKIKKETPFSLKLNDTPHVTYTQKEFKASDLKFTPEKHPYIDVAVTSHEAGAHVVSGALSYFLCSNTVCERQQTKIQHTLHVVAH